MKPLALTSSGNRSLAERLIWALKLELSTGVGCKADSSGSAGWVSALEPASANWGGRISILFPVKVGSLGKIVVGMGLAIALGVIRQATPKMKTLSRLIVLVAVLCMAIV